MPGRRPRDGDDRKTSAHLVRNVRRPRPVMEIMDAAFGARYGEAWTRSQCAGILPMAGVSLILADDGESGSAVGFSLFRSVANESELLLLAVSPNHRRRGVGRKLLQDFLGRARTRGSTESILKSAREIRRFKCIVMPVRADWPTPQLLSRTGWQPIRCAHLCARTLVFELFSTSILPIGIIAY
jgi:GNAT superfamily N-acetyltransferase